MLKRMNNIDVLQAVITTASNWLTSEEAEKEYSYLLSRISNEYLSKFSFGYFPTEYQSMIRFFDDIGKLLKTEPVPALKNANIIYITEKYNKIVPTLKNHSLLIPFYDVYNNPVSIVGRTILSEEFRKLENISKYKNLPFNKRKHLYGLNWSYRNIIKKDYVVVVEGQFDFISGFINGIDNIVALGGSKFSFEHVALLKRFTNHFYVLLDNDEAGDDGFIKINKNASKYGLRINKLALPNCKDLDDFLKNNKINDIRDFVIV